MCSMGTLGTKISSCRQRTDQTGWMLRLTWVFAGHTVTLLVFTCHSSFFDKPVLKKMKVLCYTFVQLSVHLFGINNFVCAIKEYFISVQFLSKTSLIKLWNILMKLYNNVYEVKMVCHLPEGGSPFHSVWITSLWSPFFHTILIHAITR